MKSTANNEQYTEEVLKKMHFNNLPDNHKFNISISDLKQFPFFKEAIQSDYFDFNTSSFIHYLNSSISEDTDYLIMKLLDGIVDRPENPILCTLFFDFAKALKNWYIPGLSEYDDDPGDQNLLEWTKVNHLRFHSNSELDFYEWLPVGAHVYYSLDLFESIISEELKKVFCHSLHYYLLYCIKDYSPLVLEELSTFPAFLRHRKILNSEINIYLEGDLMLKGIKNKKDCFEFFIASDSMAAYQAMENGYINRSEYDQLYCLPDNDESDLPFILYDNKFLSDEFDDYRLFQDEEDEEYTDFAYLAVLKEKCWKVYALSLDVEEAGFSRFVSLNTQELEELSGLEIEVIESQVLSML